MHPFLVIGSYSSEGPSLLLLPCVWLRDQWVGLDPTRILGTEPTHPLFVCTSDFGDGVNPFHVWLKELGIRVGWHDNTVNEGPTCHQWTPPVNLSPFSFSFFSNPYLLPRGHRARPPALGRPPSGSLRPTPRRSRPPVPGPRHRSGCAAPAGRARLL